eukprot:CAMPEP_0197846010 /NCGR_PEP_ID=MMETSP1438-20131217/2839_1 /TAXON_ID=1461541 /ORGANISM="Pterosperma sp., Strain CCMP1384" /LENGTH=556 /DNA_ID=CAMNT_0043457507 /DNA_START=108 /DNA_END=1778 /DNA_ORIENTATION=-
MQVSALRSQGGAVSAEMVASKHDRRSSSTESQVYNKQVVTRAISRRGLFRDYKQVALRSRAPAKVAQGRRMTPVVSSAASALISFPEDGAEQPQTPLMSTGGTYTIDDCLDQAGVGRYQMMTLALMLLTFAASGYQIMVSVFTETPATIGALWGLSIWQITSLKSLFFAGSLIGALAAGALSDKYGRKPTWMWANALAVSAFALSAFAPSYSVYACLRFCCGAAAQAAAIAAYSHSAEVFGLKYSATLGVVFNMCFTLGLITICGIQAFFEPTWRMLILGMSLLGWITIPFMSFVLESPRWYMGKGRVEEAEATLKQMADVNHMQLPAGSLKRPEVEKRQAGGEEKEEKAGGAAGSMADLFTNPSGLRITIAMTLLWGVSACTYYGLSLNAGNLGGSVCLNLALLFMMEIPGYFVCGWMSNQPGIGRKGAIVTLMWVSSFCCLIVWALAAYGLGLAPWVSTAVSLVGKAAVSGVFASVYVYTAELYPTYVRSSGLGFSSACARVGGAAAPQIIMLASLVSANLAQLVFAMMGAVATIALMILAGETYGKPLKDSFD